MRLVLAALLPLALAAPVASAQTLEQAAALQGTQRVALGASQVPQSGFTLDKLFDPQHFRMSHSIEYSTGSGYGGAYSLGVYTNTMQWQFDEKLAARLDLAVATSPTGIAPSGLGVSRSQGVQAYVRNAEIAYRPTRSTELRVQFQQNPYAQGVYGDPYGYGLTGYGYQQSGYVPANRSSRITATFGSGTDGDLFWRSSGR
ncbi:MAG: hypothetical protein LCH53_10315 [Bacteroidetes bacterium]|nr:hypothetical protein [Bacteroidota bacterium]